MRLNRNDCLGRKSGGFTLVETVLAIGIVATGLLVIVATAGTALDRFSSLANRDAALRLRSTLVSAFQDSAEFPSFYSAVRNGTPIYAYCFGGESEGVGSPVKASQTRSFELAEHHINRVRIATDEEFQTEISSSPFVFRVRFEFFDLTTGEEIAPGSLPEDPDTLTPLRLPAVVKLYWVSSERAMSGDDTTSGRPVTTFNFVFKP